MSSPLVQTDSLTKRFGTFTALNQCSLTIERGEVFGLLGPNGAGKSTLIRLILGFLNPTSGSATINGFDSINQRVDAHREISYLPGDARLYRLMKARNLLKLFCKFREDSDFQIAQAVAERLELDLNRWVGLMSTGMRQKLALAICLSNQASLLILDEPTANLDPTVRGQVMEIIREAKDSGRTVVFSSHVLSEIEDTCDRVGILRSGELVHLESMAALNRQHRITANLNGDMPDPPDGLADVSVKQVGQRIQIETPGELSAVLKWLADAPLTDVSVQPVGLRSVYDRFHHPASIVSKTEAKG
jgi:ABC-2 type transport system ATP-binding protein